MSCNSKVYTHCGINQTIQKEKDELAKALGYDGSIDVLIGRAAKEIQRLKELLTK